MYILALFQVVATKVKMALGQNLNVVLCIGEKLSEREAGKTLDICLSQVSAVNGKIEMRKQEVLSPMIGRRS